MTTRVRFTVVIALCLVLSSCSATGPVTGTTEPLQAPDEPRTTTSLIGAGSVPIELPNLDWSTVRLGFGVSEITEWGPSLVGLAVQDFDAPSSLIDEDDSGCVGFSTGRTGELVWSADGADWEPFPVQPYWYDGPLSPFAWAELVRRGESPFTGVPSQLISHGDELLAISLEELSDNGSNVVVDAFDPSNERWYRLGSLGSVGFDSSAVEGASGRQGTVIVAAGPDRAPTVWAVREGGLVEYTNAFASLVTEADGQWTTAIEGFDLVATADGFLAQFEIASHDPVMAYSVDGTQWNRVAHPGAGAVRLAASGSTALGANWDGMWISTDSGRSWRPVSLHEGPEFFDLNGTESGFTAWAFQEAWTSPTVWLSHDGIDWAPVLELDSDHGWINGLAMTDEAIIVSASDPSGGWVCPEIVRHEYEMHIARFE